MHARCPRGQLAVSHLIAMETSVTQSSSISVLRRVAHVSAFALGVPCALGLTTPALLAETAPGFHIQQAQFIADVGGAERINLASRLRMLSQALPAAACYIAAGIDAEQQKAILEQADTEVTLIIAAL